MPGSRRSGRPEALADLVMAYLASVDQWRSCGPKGPAVIDGRRSGRPDPSHEVLPRPPRAPVHEQTPHPQPAEVVSPEAPAPALEEAPGPDVAPATEPEPETEREMEDTASAPRPVEDLATGADLEVETDVIRRGDEALQAHLHSVMRHFLGERPLIEEVLAPPEDEASGEVGPRDGEAAPAVGKPFAEDAEEWWPPPAAAPLAPWEHKPTKDCGAQPAEAAPVPTEAALGTTSKLEDAFAPLWRGTAEPLGLTPPGGIGPTVPEVDALAVLRAEVVALRGVLMNTAALARAQGLGREPISPTSKEEKGNELPAAKVTLVASSLPPGTLLHEFVAELEEIPGVAAATLPGYGNGTAAFRVLVRSTPALMRTLMGTDRFRPASMRAVLCDLDLERPDLPGIPRTGGARRTALWRRRRWHRRSPWHRTDGQHHRDGAGHWPKHPHLSPEAKTCRILNGGTATFADGGAFSDAATTDPKYVDDSNKTAVEAHTHARRQIELAH